MSLLSLFTTDVWSGMTLTVDFGGAAQAFTPAADENSARTTLEVFVLWVAAQFPGESVTYSWARDATTAGGSITLTFANAATIVSNATAQTITGLPANSGPSVAHTSVWVGTWHAPGPIDLTEFIRELGPGPASGVGALRPGVPGLAARVPKLNAVDTALGVSRLVNELKGASLPREAWVYQEFTSTWRLLSVGRMSEPSRTGPLYNRFSIEVLG